MNWQPIETAPRDGEPVILVNGKYRREVVFGTFDNRSGRWFECFSSKEIRWPKCWMSLPEPPKEVAP